MNGEDFVKRLVELAEGFEFFDYSSEPPVIDYIYNHTLYSCDNKDIQEWEHYPLLLYRAMVGWNKKEINARTGNGMWLQPKTVYAFLEDDEVNIEFSDYQSTEYLTPQEQALEVALKEVLKNE